MALPEDMLLEIFKRLQPPTDVIRCAAVCRRWRSLISSSSSASCLPAPPSHFGFFYDYALSPWFVPTKAGADLSLGRMPLPVHSPHGVSIKDCRGGRLLLRDLIFQTELALVVCHPLERSSVRLPPLSATPADRLAFVALVPTGPSGFRVAVVLFDGPHSGRSFHIWVYHSASDAWESAGYKVGVLGTDLVSTAGQSIVVGDVAYKLQHDNKCIVAVNTAEMTLFLVPLPADAAANMYQGNHCIGRTADGRLCFFALADDKPLRLLTWVLQGPGSTWRPEEAPVALSPSAVGMDLSVWAWRRRQGSMHVGFGGFCEGSGTLFLVVACRVIALDLNTLDVEVMWADHLLRQVYPYEMLPWPPLLKDFTKPTVFTEICRDHALIRHQT